MTPVEADKIYSGGKDIVVAALCDLSSTIEKQENEINVLKIKIAKLSKNSSTSSKKPSSDDITKKEKKKRNPNFCKLTFAPGSKLVPVIVTFVADEPEPVFGVIPVTVGIAANTVAETKRLANKTIQTKQ